MTSLVEYEKYTLKKFHEITMAAIVAEGNLLKSKKTEDPVERERLLDLAIADIKAIHLTFAKDDFPGPIVRVEGENN